MMNIGGNMDPFMQPSAKIIKMFPNESAHPSERPGSNFILNEEVQPIPLIQEESHRSTESCQFAPEKHENVMGSPEDFPQWNNHTFLALSHGNADNSTTPSPPLNVDQNGDCLNENGSESFMDPASPEDENTEEYVEELRKKFILSGAMDDLKYLLYQRLNESSWNYQMVKKLRAAVRQKGEAVRFEHLHSIVKNITSDDIPKAIRDEVMEKIKCCGDKNVPT